MFQTPQIPPSPPNLRQQHEMRLSESLTPNTTRKLRLHRLQYEQVPGKTFYIETFGCQMNAHDSEKVIGTLVQQGYAQVDTPDDASLVLYNTCSIRDKAEQKVFS